MKFYCLLSIYCCLILRCHSQTVGTSIDPQLLTNKVKELMESTLKYSKMQNHFDTLQYTSHSPNGRNLLDALSNTFGNKFQSRISAVKRLREAVVNSYSGTNYNTKQCCRTSSGELEYDSRFKQPVSPSKVCELVSSSSQSNAVRLQNAFRDACVDNLQSVPSLKWQYFGSEQGVTTQFPATKASSCGTYDNRFRPWYVQTNVPEPKQVVIVIDQSGSMSKTYGGTTYMDLAKQAANTVVDTLNPYDQFALIAFSSSAVTYQSRFPVNNFCFQTSFAQATSQNKKLMRKFTESVYANGGTKYGIALEKAFDYFDSAKDSLNRKMERVILFMSDGEPNDKEVDIQRTLKSRNQLLNNSVVLMTFGMGSANFGVLQRMATSTSHENQAGVFTHITTPTNLRNEMASYYNYFSTKSIGSLSDEPIWTVPYLDSWGLGLMMTASLPVYVSGRLVGVAAVDLTIEELLAESSYFKPTDLSFSFVLNEAGLVINHPLFPYVTDRDPLYVEATAFERNEDFLTVYDSMKKGNSGSLTFNSIRILPQGDGRKYGVRTVNIDSTYYWKKIPGTKFSICLVLTEGDLQTSLRSQGSIPAGGFLYHRLDLVHPRQPCAHVNSYGSKDHSAVALAARSFVEPELYLSTQATVANVRKIVDYMEGKTTTTPNIKEGVKEMVVATYKADSLWNEADNDQLTQHVFWRYVATKEGIMRIFPGTRMPDNYDPVVRGWYEQSQANRNKYVITTPYSDAASAINIITLTRALFEKSPGVQGSTTGKLIGAMGADIVANYFPTIVNQLYPICNDSLSTYTCIIIDQGGFVIMTTDKRTSENKHVIELEPGISAQLVKQGIMQNTSCSNIEDALIQHTFLVKINGREFHGKTSHPRCKSFVIYPVQETNAFILVINNKGSCSSFSYDSCSCNQIIGNAAEPTCSTSASCNCPCTTHNNAFFPCKNKYISNSSWPLPCTPDTPDLTNAGTPPGVDLTTLQICYQLAYSYTNVYNNTKDTKTTDKNDDVVIGASIGGVAAFLLICYVIHQHNKKAKVKPTNSPRTTPTTTAHTAPTPAPNPATNVYLQREVVYTVNMGVTKPPAAASSAPPSGLPPPYSVEQTNNYKY